MTPFDEGVVAAQTRMSKDDNPHPKGSPAPSDWEAGYNSAVEAHDATRADNEQTP